MLQNTATWSDEHTFGNSGALKAVMGGSENIMWQSSSYDDGADWSSYDSLLFWVYSEQECDIDLPIVSNEHSWSVSGSGTVEAGQWSIIKLGFASNEKTIVQFGIANATGVERTIYVGRISLKRNGSSTVTINPSQHFEDSTTYYVLVDSTAFSNSDDEQFAGYYQPHNWRFSTGDEIIAGPDHYIWDTDATDGFQAADGTWGADNFWTVDGNSLFSWPDSNSSAEFAAEGGANVTVLGTQNVDSVLFSAEGYTLDGDTLNVTGDNASIITDAEATIQATLQSAEALEKKGSAQLTISGANDHQLEQFHLLSGSTVIESGTFNITGNNANQVSMDIGGDLTFAAGEINAAGDIVFGSTDDVVIALSGDVAAENGIIGQNAGPVVTITDGTHSFSGALYHADGGNAVLNIEGGTVSAPEVYSITDAAADEFTINLNDGGTLETGRIYLSLGETASDEGSHSLVFTFDGGLLRVTDDENPLFDDILGGGASDSSFEISVLDGGARINTNGYNTSIRRPIVHGGVDALDGGLTKLGEEVLTLSSVTNYTGPTEILEGTLRLGADNILPHGSGYGNVTITDKLDLNGYSDTVNGLGGNGTITSSAEGDAVLTVGANDAEFVFDGLIEDGIGRVLLVKDGDGRMTLSGDNTFTGGVTIAGGALQLGDGGTSGEIDGGIVNNATLVFNRSDSVVFNPAISGVGELHQDGSGVLILGGDNTYEGGTFINNGSVAVETATSLGTDAVRINSGARQLILGDGLTFGNDIVIDGGAGPESGAGTIHTTGTATLAGDISILDAANSGIHFSSENQTDTLMISAAIAAPMGVAVGLAHAHVSLSGGTYGQIDILQGTTSLGADSGISAEAMVNMAAMGDAVLDLNGYDLAIKGIFASEDNSAVITNSGDNASTLSLDVNDTTCIIGGEISGDLSLVKDGDGKVVLGGAGTYTGTTSVNGGVLRMDGILSGAGDITVKQDATLDIAGSIEAGVSVADSGILSCDSEGLSKISLNGLELEENSIINIGIDSVSDTIAVSGDLVADGIVNIDFGAGAQAGTYTIMTCQNEIIDNEIRIGEAPGDLLYEIHIRDGEVQLEIIVPVITEIQNPIVLGGERINDGEVELTITGFGDMPSLPNQFSPWADTVAIWYRAESFHSEPDVNEEYLRKYSLNSLKYNGTTDTADTFVTTIPVPIPDSEENSYFYFVGTMFWRDPQTGTDSIPPFIHEQGCSVRVVSRTIFNPLSVSSIYDEVESLVAVTVDGIQRLPEHTDSVGIWYGFDGNPDFSNERETRWLDYDEFFSSGDSYNDTVNLSDSTISTFYYAVVLKDTSDSFSDIKMGSQPIGAERPDNELALSANAIGPQDVILDWSAEPFENDSVRIWYSTDSIESVHSLVVGPVYKLLYPRRSQASDTIHTLFPATTYYFGLQRYDGGLWSDITEESRAKVTTPNSSGANIDNNVVIDLMQYNDEEHSITVFWSIDDTTGLSEYDLQLGAEYSFDGYPETVGPNTQVRDISSFQDSITLQLQEKFISDVFCYISLYLRAEGDMFVSATDSSRDSIVVPRQTAQEIEFFQEGEYEAGVFNNAIVFRRGTKYFKNKFTVNLYEPDTDVFHGFVPVGPGFTFDRPSGVPPFKTGIRYDSIPQGYNEDDLHIYRITPDEKVKVEYDSYTEDGFVWIETNEIEEPFMVLVDTIQPQVDFSMRDTGAAITADGEMFQQRFSIRDNCGNVTYSIRASTGDKWYQYQLDSTLADTSVSINARIPKRDNPQEQLVGCVSELYGMRAILIVSDGVNVDTINISRQVLTDDIGQVPTPRIKPGWVPFAVGGTLHDNSIRSVLDELIEEDSYEWEYDIYRFRLFRYMGEGVEAADENGWLEYDESVEDFFELNPGRLLWLKTKEGQVIRLGEGLTTSLKEPFEITLAPGRWTDFASPFQFDIPLSAVLEATEENIDSIQLYHWEKDEEENVYKASELYISTMDDLQESVSGEVISGQVGNFGYTAFNPLQEPVVLRIPPIPFVEQAAAKRAVAHSHGSQWGVRFNWRAADQHSFRNIRCLVDKRLGKSQQIYALAPSFGSVGAGVVDTSNQTLGGHVITQDTDRQGYSWQISLYNQGRESKTIAYKLGDLSLPPNMEARIWDAQKQTFETLDDVREETLKPLSEKTKWVVVGTQAYLLDFKRNAPGVKLAFAGCYPNPFAGRLSIRYTVPGEKLRSIAFSIYDVQGRLIWHQAIKNPESGSRIHMWDGRSIDNRTVAAGNYILRMTATGLDGVRKVIGEQRIVYLPR
ncbi:MAG: autotransporter-associated beta strand repeat-containing protein [Chitinivibrionales bacterium]